MSQSGTTFGSVVTYECNENYQFAGEDMKQRTCLASGIWSNEEIICGMIIHCIYITYVCILSQLLFLFLMHISKLTYHVICVQPNVYPVQLVCSFLPSTCDRSSLIYRLYSYTIDNTHNYVHSHNYMFPYRYGKHCGNNSRYDVVCMLYTYACILSQLPFFLLMHISKLTYNVACM